MRIGILGGTFDPIHIAHIRVAETVQKKLNLEKVIFVPAYTPPHKHRKDIATARARYEMVKLALENRRCFEVSDIEIKRKGASYSVDTLKAFKKQFGPNADLFFIAGSDSLFELSAWKDIEEVFALSRFIVVTRPGFPVKKLPAGVKALEIPEMDISSSGVRKRLKEGKGADGIVPDKVLAYIRRNRLYV